MQWLGLLQQIVEAVAHCHRSGVLHRNLSPASVLVRRGSDGRIHVRLHRFQTAAWIEHSSVGTRHFHQLSQDIDRLYLPRGLVDDAAKILSAAGSQMVLQDRRPTGPTRDFTFTGTLSADQEAAVTAFAALAERLEWHLTRPLWRLLLSAARMAAESPNPKLRRYAGKTLLRRLPNVPKGLRREAEALINQLRTDPSASVRNAFRESDTAVELD